MIKWFQVFLTVLVETQQKDGALAKGLLNKPITVRLLNMSRWIKNPFY